MARTAVTSIIASNRATIARMQAAVEGLSTVAIAKADRLAMASVSRRIEPVAKRVIRQRYNVKAGELAGQFRVRLSRGDGGQTLELSATTRGVPLISFGGRWRGPARRRNGSWAPSATAEILRGQRKSYGSAFIASVRGRRQVYVRQFSADSNSPSGRAPRNKLRALRGPSVFQMTQGLDDVNARAIADEMTRYRSSEIVRQLNRARKA